MREILLTWHPGAHPEIFKEGGFNFSKSNHYPIVVSLTTNENAHNNSQTGFPSNSCICLFRNPVTMILKVVGCEDCVQENKLPLWGPGGKAPSGLAILAIFSEKIAIITPFR